MILSIVIVNYNVRYFLEQCLDSVFRSDLLLDNDPPGDFPNASGERLVLEVFVVDNASVDGSVEMVRKRFPQVHLIANNSNVGFASANNQALRICHGDLMLLLNPDTVVEHDTLVKCARFYAQHPDCGGLGVKMVNGEGRFLKESKRGFPSPAASFFKMSGLIHLLPHSRKVAAYYMGHLPDDETNAIDILPGAFLMINRQALEKVGLLDETYFMYGEDIDFSWRIKLAGFENYYYPSARIIHYKGECTKHGSMNYVYTFYNAMAIFVRHYFSGGQARVFNLLLHLAIWIRATMAWLFRIATTMALPLADFAIAFGGFYLIKQLWATHWASDINYYPPIYTWCIVPVYILLLMLCSWLYGGYMKPCKPSRIVKGMVVGSAMLLVFYSLLNENMRYSRMLLLLGCAWTLLSNLGIRGMLSLLQVKGYDMQPAQRRSCLVIGSNEETSRVEQLYASLGTTQIQCLNDTLIDSRQLLDAIHIYKANEVIFCSRDLSISRIIDMMTQLAHTAGRRTPVEYKIVPDERDFIIGTHSISSAEDLYAEELHTIASPLNRRNKRLLDIVVSLLLLLLSPLLLVFQHHRKSYFPHCWQVITGRRSWVGRTLDNGAADSLPAGIFGPEDILPHHTGPLSAELKQRLYLRYLHQYKLSTDLQILAKNIFNI